MITIKNLKACALVAFALFIACPAGAQKKAETKLYNKTLAKPSLAAFDKFLKKYPSSVYSDDILARKDTLLNISPYDMAAAEDILGSFIPGGSGILAFAVRSEGIDRIYGVCTSADSLDVDSIRLTQLEREDDSWKVLSSFDQSFIVPEGAVSKALMDSSYTFRMRGNTCLRFNLLVNCADGVHQGYTSAIYNPAEDELSSVSFEGKSTLKSSDVAPYRIAGRSGINLVAGSNRPQYVLLQKELEDNPLLEEIPEGDYLTDACIEWWLEHNPEALSTAKSLQFNVIPAEASLIEQYTKAKGKQNAANYRAAMFDYRGYTVIVAYQKAHDNYVLAWAEPECKDHARGRLLNNIFFENATTLTLFYYQGSRTFKYHLNLASKALKR